jgi:hypothetical protein
MKKLPLKKALKLKLYSAIDSDKLKYQWREIGEGQWLDTDNPDWIMYCEQSCEHDTRVVSIDT